MRRRHKDGASSRRPTSKIIWGYMSITRWAFAVMLLLGSFISGPLHAQGITPPPRQDTKSEGGVSFGSGTYSYEAPMQIQIGGEGEAGLSLQPTYISNMNGAFADGLFTQGWTHNYVGIVTNSPLPVDEEFPPPPGNAPYMYSVSVGGSSQGFLGGSRNPTGGPVGTYRPSSPSGASLEFVGTASTGHYIYTDGSGSVINFSSNERMLDWTFPDGTRLDFTYVPGGLKSVFSSRGYALLFEISGGAWGKACAINLSRTYVTPTSDCPANAPTVSFSYTGAPGNPDYKLLSGITDAAGGTTSYSYVGANHLGCVKNPGQSTCSISNTYNVCHRDPVLLVDPPFMHDNEQILSQVRADGKTFTYPFLATPQCTGSMAYSVSGGVVHINGTSTITVPTNGAGMPISFTDEIGRVRSFIYWGNSTLESEENQVAGIITPEGNRDTYVYDLRGNVTEYRRIAKSGSGLPDQVETASYPGTCTNRLTCNKPVYVTDAKGAITDYTYDAIHGGVLTVMQPAPVAGGARPLVVKGYVQKYAYVLSGGSLVPAATPVWVPATETECQTVAGSNVPVCDSGGPQRVTTYEYGPNGTADNLLLRGVAVTAGGVTLRTCYGYDTQGRRISETKPAANLSVCP